MLLGHLPAALQQAAEMYAGCVSGAIQMDDYLTLARAAGFQNLTVQKQKPILIPDDVLLQYLSADELRGFVASGTAICSITLYAEKAGEAVAKPKIQLADLPLAKCGPGCNC